MSVFNFMNLHRRITLVFFSILILGWLSLQWPLYEHIGLVGILLPGLLFGLSFSLVNFKGRRQRINGIILSSLFATVSIVVAFLLMFSWGPEGTGIEGIKFGFLLGFCCSTLLTIMFYATYGLSWPAVLLAIILGSTLPALLGFEEGGETTVKPQLFGYFWLAVMGAVYSFGLKRELTNKT